MNKELLIVMLICGGMFACQRERPVARAVAPNVPLMREMEVALPEPPPPPLDSDAELPEAPAEEFLPPPPPAPEMQLIISGPPSGMGIATDIARRHAPVEKDDSGDSQTRLTRALRQFVVTQKRVPKSVEELVTAGTIAEIPAPPKGKEYQIDDTALMVRLGKNK